MGIGKKSEIEKNEYPIIAEYEGGSIILTQLDALVNWSRSNSLWPLTFGTRCCAMEMMATGASRHDFARFGFEVARATPRQADMIIIAGSINYKMAPVLKRLYDQIADPKYVIAMGACAVSGGPFFYNSYAIMKGADHVIPVDVYIPGCPPRPEALLYGMMQLQKKIKREKNFKKRKLVDVKPVLDQK
jgi:NADH-quinone oxidoreductase subunit B